MEETKDRNNDVADKWCLCNMVINTIRISMGKEPRKVPDIYRDTYNELFSKIYGEKDNTKK